ncbi:helix-turn-helix domain-containing protein [Weissella confusa]|uniref:Helix-turn-helix domain-containing protein n=1 Tax=Weissella confusa TaxID=1583 RepID=A0A923NIG3_WEICO|nr:helix-turn-helix domain-containing protein [Weissella confusa]
MLVNSLFEEYLDAMIRNLSKHAILPAVVVVIDMTNLPALEELIQDRLKRSPMLKTIVKTEYQALFSQELSERILNRVTSQLSATNMRTAYFSVYGYRPTPDLEIAHRDFPIHTAFVLRNSAKWDAEHQATRAGLIELMGSFVSLPKAVVEREADFAIASLYSTGFASSVPVSLLTEVAQKKLARHGNHEIPFPPEMRERTEQAVLAIANLFNIPLRETTKQAMRMQFTIWYYRLINDHHLLPEEIPTLLTIIFTGTFESYEQFAETFHTSVPIARTAKSKIATVLKQANIKLTLHNGLVRNETTIRIFFFGLMRQARWSRYRTLSTITMLLDDLETYFPNEPTAYAYDEKQKAVTVNRAVLVDVKTVAFDYRQKSVIWQLLGRLFFKKCLPLH